MRIDISGLDEVVERLKVIDDEGIKNKAQAALDVAAFDILAVAQMRSPVDKGHFKQAWQISQEPIEGAGVIAGKKITNTMPYSGPLEHGSPEGGQPWPKAGPKTTLESGRIWSSQAVGGVVGPVLVDIMDFAAKAVVDGIGAK